MSTFDIEGFRSILLNAILMRLDIQALFSELYTTFNLPMIALDVSFHSLAYAFERPFDYEHWENIVSQGYASKEVVDNNNYLNYQEMMYSNKRAQIFDWGTCENYPQAAGAIVHNGALQGYISIMLKDSTLSVETAIEITDMLSETISLMLNKESTLVPESMPQDQLLDYLIDEQVYPPEFLINFSKVCPPPYFLAILSSDSPAVATFNYLLSRLNTHGKKVLGSLRDHKNLYILYFNISSDIPLKNVQESLIQFIQGHNFIGGISDLFIDISTISIRQLQALTAIHIHSSNPKAYVYSFFESYSSIISYAALNHLGDLAAIDAKILKLAKYDCKKNTDLLETLKNYLRFFKGLTQTADIMNLHKNTINYRIQKIKEIIDFDIDNPQECERLALAIDIYDTLHSPHYITEGVSEHV